MLEPLRAFFETADVALAATSFDIGLLAAAAGEVPQIVIGWSPRDYLASKPEFAILSVTSIPYVRLPVSLEDLRASVDEARRVTHHENAMHLCTPIGQWKASLQNLARIDDRVAALTALSELERFAHERWPLWHDRRCAALRDRVEHGDDPMALIEPLCIAAEDAAIIQALRPLKRWVSSREKRERIALTRDRLSFARQDLQTEAELEEALHDRWWDELAADLVAVQRELVLLKDMRVDVAPAIDEMLIRLGTSVARLAGICRLIDVNDEIDIVLDALTTIDVSRASAGEVGS